MSEQSREEFKKLVENTERASRRSTVLLVTMIVLVGGGVFAYVGISYFNKKERLKQEVAMHEKEIQEKATTDLEIVYESGWEQHGQDLTEVASSEEDSLLEMVRLKKYYAQKIDRYFDLVDRQEKDSLQLMYSDVLDEYYGMADIPKKKVYEIQNKTWKSHPNQVFRNKRIEFGEDPEEVWLYTEHSLNGKDFETLRMNFKFNEEDEIYFIKSHSARRMANKSLNSKDVIGSY